MLVVLQRNVVGFQLQQRIAGRFVATIAFQPKLVREIAIVWLAILFVRRRLDRLGIVRRLQFQSEELSAVSAEWLIVLAPWFQLRRLFDDRLGWNGFSIHSRSTVPVEFPEWLSHWFRGAIGGRRHSTVPVESSERR